MNKKVILGEMTWTEAKDMFKKAKVVIIVTGSTKQHGPHLPLQHDAFSAYYIAKKAAEAIYPNAIIVFPISLGTSSFHITFFPIKAIASFLDLQKSNFTKYS